MISTTIGAELYARIKKEKLRINELIESAIHYKDMDIRDAKELKERLERMSILVDKLSKRVWELEGKMLDIKGDKNGILGN